MTHLYLNYWVKFKYDFKPNQVKYIDVCYRYFYLCGQIVFLTYVLLAEI